jgi:integrase/recombinase XerD
MLTTRTELAKRMLADLQLAGMGTRTQEAYLRSVRKLAEHYRTPPDRISEDQLREYFLHLKNERGFASGSLKIAWSGIKFFLPIPRPATGIP